MLDEKQKEQILSGRKIIDTHRIEHVKLYVTVGIKDIPSAHTPLLEALMKAMAVLPFKDINEFFETSGLFNVQELGYENFDTFAIQATSAEKETLKKMWK